MSKLILKALAIVMIALSAGFFGSHLRMQYDMKRNDSTYQEAQYRFQIDQHVKYFAPSQYNENDVIIIVDKETGKRFIGVRGFNLTEF